jgi:hypothetical protein
VPSSALFFAVYQTSKAFVLEGLFGRGSPASQLLASGLGNLAASTIRVPTEVVKTRMQSEGSLEASAPHPTASVARPAPPGLARWALTGGGAGGVVRPHHLRQGRRARLLPRLPW